MPYSRLVVDEFALFLSYCKVLKFSDTPDYEVLIQMLTSIKIKKGEDKGFDWNYLPTASCSDTNLAKSTTDRQDIGGEEEKKGEKDAESCGDIDIPVERTGTSIIPTDGWIKSNYVKAIGNMTYR